ncbi:MAG TPA: hypothetical protein VFQ53_15825 [Kofleriaceae bacterium]|nr:hypothetical protein [Kofleriaceae bacterium]
MTRLFALLLAIAGCGSKHPQMVVSGPPPDHQPAATPEPPPSPPPPEKPEPPKSLYDRLGGNDAVTAVVDELVTRATADPRIKLRFFNTDAANLKKLLAELVCLVTGGPCTYTGRNMYASHAAMDVVEDELKALVEDLAAALDKLHVPDQEKSELVAALGPLTPEILAPAENLRPIADAQLDKVTKLAAAQKDPAVQELLAAAVVAGKRGQRNYAEQLFTRAELATGPKPLASVAKVFRDGAPPRVATTAKPAKDATPQPAQAGNSDEDYKDPAPKQVGTLAGTLKVEGKIPSGMGVVTLTPIKGGKKRTPKTRVIEQRDKTFAPHVTAVPVGSTIQFPNFDPILHNVFSLSSSKPFDLGMYRTGQQREVRFDKPGIVRLGCNLHANMSAYVVVVDAPHYVVVQPDGTFAFKALAPGKYRVAAWTEQSAEPTLSELEIKDGANTATLDVKADAPPGPSTDKFGGSRTAAK